MPKPKYAAGLRFVVSTPESDHAAAKKDRRTIRSHAARAHPKRRDGVQLRSWISPGRRLVLNKSGAELPAAELPVVPAPLRAGSDFSALQLPSGVEPRMVQDLVRLIDINKHGTYPFEICLNVHPVDRGWFPYMMSDLCCLHSMMFSIRAYLDNDSHGGRESRLAVFHYTQTLQLLQDRLNAFERGSMISDATLMVVITLATAAELTDDSAAAANHIDGLHKIVALRGGVRALNTHNNMQVKVCRADLGFALRFGHRPRLFRQGIAWDCFIADRGMIRCSHGPHAAEIDAFVGTLDPRLGNAWADLHAFSCISNLAYQTTRKLSPETYNEMMISILYRLAHLDFEDDPLQEATRTGLLAYATTLFLQRNFLQKPYVNLVDDYGAALNELRRSTIPVPAPVALWFTMLYHIFAFRDLSAEGWPSAWLGEAVSQSCVDSWSQAHEKLRSIMWIDFIHDKPGEKLFDVAISRA